MEIADLAADWEIESETTLFFPNFAQHFDLPAHRLMRVDDFLCSLAFLDL